MQFFLKTIKISYQVKTSTIWNELKLPKISTLYNAQLKHVL